MSAGPAPGVVRTRRRQGRRCAGLSPPGCRESAELAQDAMEGKGVGLLSGTMLRAATIRRTTHFRPFLAVAVPPLSRLPGLTQGERRSNRGEQSRIGKEERAGPSGGLRPNGWNCCTNCPAAGVKNWLSLWLSVVSCHQEWGRTAWLLPGASPERMG